MTEDLDNIGAEFDAQLESGSALDENILKDSEAPTLGEPVTQTEEDLDVGDYAADVGLGIGRGIIGFGQSLYDLADYVTADILPDINMNDKLGLAETKTFAGGLSEGITQFLAGFVPVAGALGKAAQIGKAAGSLNKFGKFVAISKNVGVKSKVSLNWKGDLIAGSVADFVSFDAQEERLSNLVEAHPDLSNPVTQFLAAGEDDNELLGRLKNSIEGVMTEIGVSVVLKHGLLKSLDVLKKARGEVKVNEADPLSMLDQSVIDAEDLGRTGSDNFESKIYKDDGATIDEDTFKSSVWEPEDLEDGAKSLPFTPMRDKPNQDINSARGVDAMMDRFNNEVRSGKLGIERDEVKRVQEFFDMVGDEPFNDVAVSFTNRLQGSALFDFTKGVAEIGNNVVSKGQLEPTFFHEMWHAASRSLNEKDVADVSKAYKKGRKAYEKSDPVFADVAKLTKDFESNIVTKEAYDNLVKKHGEAISSRFKPSGKKNMAFFFHDDNYRFQNSDEWFAESMKDSVMGRLDKSSAPDGSIGKVFEGMTEYVKSIYNALKRKLGFDPTEDFLNKYIQRKRTAIKTNGTIGDAATGGIRKMEDLSAAKKELTPRESQLAVNRQAMKDSTKAGEKLMKGQMGDLKFQKSKTKPSILAGTPAALEGLLQGVHNVLNKESIKRATLSMKDVQENTGTMIDAFLDDMNQMGGDIVDAVGRRADLPISLDDAGAFTYSIRTFQDMVNMELMDVVGKAKALPERNTEQAQEMVATVKALIYQNASLEAKNSEFVASKLGSGLQAQQKTRAAKSFKKVNLSMDEVADRAKRLDFLDQTKEMKEKDLWKLVDLLDKSGDSILRDPTLLPKLLDKDIITIASDGLYKYWINALLSGPKTHAANLASAALHSSMRSLYMTTGAVFDKNNEMAGAILNTVITKQNDANMALRFADMMEKGKETFKTGVSDFEGVGAKTFQDAPEDSAASYLNSVISAPTRALLGEDAVMKQLEFKKTIERQAYNDALFNKGLTDPNEISEYVARVKKAAYTNEGRINNPYNARKEAENALKKSGEWDQMDTPAKMNARLEAEGAAGQRLGEFGELQGKALEDANKTLFLNSADGMAGKWQEWLTTAPSGVRWIIPFTKTPINVIVSGMSLAFAPAKGLAAAGARAIPEDGALSGLRKKILDGYNSEDPLIRQETKGKLAVSSALWATTVTAINSNALTITGGGARDPAERKRMEDAGWQKYSVKVGGKYYSYQRLDPLAMVLGLASDVRDHTNDPAGDVDGLHSSFAAVAMTAMHNNVLDKSFLVGLDSFLNALNDDNKMESWLRNTVGSFVPSIIPQANEIATGSPITAEAWGFTDAIQRRLVLGSGGLDPKRNILGEEVSSQELSSVTDRMFDIVANVSESKNDVVLEEIASLRQGFDIPAKVIAGGINLTEFDGAGGRTAYDFYRKAHGTVKVGGKTLRQSLTKTIKSNWYQNIDATSYPNFKSQRIKELQKIIRRHRAKALEETMLEFPQIRSLSEDSATIRNSQRGGGNIQSQVEKLIQSQQ